jgi:type I restriction enzyme S subunit
MNVVKLESLTDRKIGYGIVQPGASVPNGIPVIKVNNIISGLRNISDLDTTTVENESKYTRTRLVGGELIISVVGTIGKTAIVPADFAGCNLVRATAMIDIKDPLITQWVKYYIDSPMGQHYIAENLNTTVQPTLNVKSLVEMPIPMYSSEYIENVVSILKSLDDKIECNRRINENLEQQAQALFKSWFVDFEPFKDQPFVESELGMIPQGWRVGDIYEYINVIYGAPYKSSLFNDKKEGLPLIRIRDLKTNAPQFYTPETLPNTEIVKAGDIVAGMDAEFIPYVWLGEHGVLNQRCCKFNGKDDEISNYYILFLIKPLLEYVQSYKTGTTVSHLGKADIDRFRFITPPLEIIKSFSRIVDNLLKEVVNKSKESRRLAELRDTLLPKLMSGELKVENVTF